MNGISKWCSENPNLVIIIFLILLCVVMIVFQQSIEILIGGIIGYLSNGDTTANKKNNLLPHDNINSTDVNNENEQN